MLLTHGRGVYLWDANGKRYLDLLSGIGVNGLGHAHPAVMKTIMKQAGKMIHMSNLFFHEYQAELAKKLTKISGLDRAFFTNSGTEAIEGALKLARAYANPQQEWFGSEVENYRARKFVSWTDVWSAVDYWADEVPCAVRAGGCRA